jgi:hypothetical protein
MTDWPTWPSQPADDFQTTMAQVRDWPLWAAGNNPRHYRLPANVGRLDVARGSFRFEANGLPPPPNYQVISP